MEQNIDWVVSDECGAAGEQVIEDRSETIDIGQFSDGSLAGSLFGGHICGSSQNLAGGCDFRSASQLFREAEVGHLRRSLGVDQDVPGLEITVDNSMSVSVRDGHSASHKVASSVSTVEAPRFSTTILVNARRPVRLR